MAEKVIDVAMESTAQEILSQMGQGVTANVVKSIQRQQVSTNKDPVTFTISAVDPDKSIIITSGGSGANPCKLPWVTAFTSTSVTLSTGGNGNYDGQYGLEVVEFY